MKSIKLSLVAALLASSSLVADMVSDVEVSANVAMTSNYVWRGMTQTGNNPAVQGGFDASYKGAYIGIWGSSFEGSKASSEIDLYAGYANAIGAFSYDVNYCQYTYPGDTDALNFGEASLTLGYDFEVASVSGKYYVGIDTNDLSTGDAANGWEPGDGWELGVSVPLPMDITLDGTYGQYDDEGTQNVTANQYGDYYYVGASKTFGKFDVTVAYTGMDYDNAATKDQDSLVVTVGTSF